MLAAVLVALSWSVLASRALHSSKQHKCLCVTLRGACPGGTLTRACAVAGWVPAKKCYCALHFAPPEAMPELLVEAVALMLDAGETSSIVRCIGLIDCSAALPPDRDLEPYTKVFLSRLLERMPKHLACGAGCLVLELHEDCLFYAIHKRALACITCQAGCFAAPLKELCIRSAPVLRRADMRVCAAQAA